MSTGDWTFDDEVLVARFEQELVQNVPGFESLRRLVHEVLMDGWDPAFPLVDLGASTGEQVSRALSSVPMTARAWLIEKSPAMANRLRERFAARPNAVVFEQDVELFCSSIWQKAQLPVSWGAALAMLTLQFVRVEARETIIRAAYERLLPGAPFVLVEKVLPDNHRAGTGLRRLLMRHKSREGMTHAEILRKEARISGVLVPLPASENERMLRDAGFAVDLFWAAGEFRGWLAIK